MSQMWLDKLEAATSQVERDEILLRGFKELRRVTTTLSDYRQRDRLFDDVEEQLRALASRALTVI